MSEKPKINLVENPPVAPEVTKAGKSAREIAESIRKSLETARGIRNLFERKRLREDAKYWDENAQRKEDHAESILKIDPLIYIKNLTTLFKKHVPGFNESDGVWPNEDKDVSLSWKTDPNTGERTVNLMRVEGVEQGMISKHYITWSGNNAPEATETDFQVFDYKEGRYVVKGGPHSSSDQFSINTELIRSYDMWKYALTAPDSIFKKYLDQPVQTVQ
jgi:transposase